MSRTVPEWIGKTDDAPVPPRIRLRIFDTYDGRCQCGCARKIAVGEAWELDHYVPLISGGANSETNLRPMLKAHHAVKTSADVALKSKNYRVRSRHVGIKKPRTIVAWRKFDGSPVRASKSRT